MNQRMDFRLAAVAAAAAVLTWTIPAAASDLARLDTERFRAAPDATGGFAVGDTTILAPGKYALRFTLNEAVRPLVLSRVGGEQVTLVGNRIGGTLTGMVGVAGPFAMGLELPVVLLQNGSLEALPQSVRPTEDGGLGMVGLGDLRLLPRFGVLQQHVHGVDLAIDGALTVPTGRSSAMLGDDGLGGGATVTVGRTFGELRVLGQTGVRLRPSREVMRVNVGSELLLRAAALYSLPRSVRAYMPAEVIGELDLATLAASPFQGATTPAEWRAGARFCGFGPLAVTAGVGGALSGAYGTPIMRGLVSVGFDPRACGRGDRDGDGIPDGQDRCPSMPGLPEHDGCASPAVQDTDADGVPDDRDRCPEVAGLPENEGCPPGAPTEEGPADRDGDGIPDDKDLCPDVAGIPEFRGCPFPDKDGDGVPDDEDLCPREFGLRERGGCPLRDRDGDGVEDFEDRCPEEAGEKARFGCPLRDGDLDGVPDDEDNCPGEAGSAANFGCPTPQKVALRLELIELLEKVAFKGETAEIAPASHALLDQLAKVIAAQPQLPRVLIEAHTDNRGDEQELKTRSQAQATAVRDYLVTRGVKAERLVAIGRAADSPVAPNLTAKGRESNRRIEVRIVTAEEAEVALPLQLAPELELTVPEFHPLSLEPEAEVTPPPAGPADEPSFFDELPLPPLDELPPLD